MSATFGYVFPNASEQTQAKPVQGKQGKKMQAKQHASSTFHTTAAPPRDARVKQAVGEEEDWAAWKKQAREANESLKAELKEVRQEAQKAEDLRRRLAKAEGDLKAAKDQFAEAKQKGAELSVENRRLREAKQAVETLNSELEQKAGSEALLADYGRAKEQIALCSEMCQHIEQLLGICADVCDDCEVSREILDAQKNVQELVAQLAYLD